jgi:alpha-L-rhamnosidase
MKTQTVSSRAVCACGFLLVLAALLGRNCNAHTQPSAHASNLPGRKVSKRAYLLSPLGANPSPDGLMCDLLAHPEKVDLVNLTPRFSWVVPGSGRDERQTAYRIRVAESSAALAKAKPYWWDSGKVAADRSTSVAYAGPALEVGHSYVWQVQTWDRQEHISAWSSLQQFRVGQQALSAVTQEHFTTPRYPVDQVEVAPVKVQELGPGHYFLDFGRDAFAGLQLKLTNTEAGRKMVVHLGEAQSDGPTVNRKPGGSVRYRRAEITLQAGHQRYIVPLTSNDARRMSADIGPVMPFRYVEIENCPDKLTEDSARQIAVRYPFDEHAARFSSSDSTLNAVWELCRYSIAATTYAGVYVDGDRERKPYEADAYIDQLGHYSIDREFTLARYSHEYLIQHPTWPTEWILHSVLMAWTDYLYTGDDRSLRTFYLDLKAKTLSALERPDGLISTVNPAVSKEILTSIHGEPLRDIVDWPAGERDGYEMRPVNTVVNAFHYQALALMSQIAEAVQKPADAAFYRDRAAKVRQAFNTTLFDPQTGLYVDGEGSSHSSLHANMFALAFDLVPKERMAKVAAFVRSRGMACSVYGAQFLMEALYRSGQADYALSLLTAHTDRSWSHMLDVGSTITLEAWDTRFKPNQDWNHAWGAAPANIIPRLLMGVEPIKPGFRRIRFRPQPGGLEQAALTLPTIRGAVHVSFKIEPHKVHLQTDIPANTTAQVWVPCHGLQATSVQVDGVKRNGRQENDSIVFENVGSGAHTFDLTGITPIRQPPVLKNCRQGEMILCSGQ